MLLCKNILINIVTIVILFTSINISSVNIQTLAATFNHNIYLCPNLISAPPVQPINKEDDITYTDENVSPAQFGHPVRLLQEGLTPAATHLNVINPAIEQLSDGELPSIFPPQIQLDLTNRCDRRGKKSPDGCPYCAYPEIGNEDLDLDRITRFLAYFEKHGGKVVFLTGGGEPGMYPQLEEFLVFMAGTGLRLSMNTNSLFIERLIRFAEKNPELIGKIWGADKVRETISISCHGKESFDRIKQLKELRERLGLNFNIRTTTLVEASMTVEDIKNFILNSQQSGADIAAPKPVHNPTERFGERVIDSNQAVHDYLVNLPKGKYRIKVESVRINRVADGYIRTKPDYYWQVTCLASLTRIVVNAFSELSICCNTKLPGAGADGLYFPAGEGLRLSVPGYYLDILLKN